MICKSCGTIQGAGAECGRCRGPLAAESANLERIRRHFTGKYEFIRLLGAGGYAEVYLAHDILLDRDIAFKILLSAYTQDPQMRERFIREARLYARLEHPNLIPVYDTGILDDDAYIAMKFIDGETLKSRLLRERRIGDPRLLATIAAQVGSALAYIHEAGIVHRDIKPANILIDRRTGGFYLADFGIARFESSQTLTHTGMIVGTPFYISPEQIRGKKIDRRSDIYALGATFYELIAGEPPFQGNSPLEIMYQHVNEEAPPLSGRAPGTPEVWLTIVGRCMQKDPERRFQSLSEILALVRPAGATSVIAAPPRRRRSWRLPAAAAAVVAAALVFLAVRSGRRPPDSPPAPAERPAVAEKRPPAGLPAPSEPEKRKAAEEIGARPGQVTSKRPEPQREPPAERPGTGAAARQAAAASPPPPDARGSVLFSSFPPNPPVDVYYNGRKIGSTEQQFEVAFAAGRHTFTFVIPEYQSAEIPVEVRPGETARAHFRFTPFREVTVNAVPFAGVSIDGREIGNTPCHVKLAFGAHQIRVVKPGYRSEERTVQIDRSSADVVSFKLTKEEKNESQ